jgi:predicted amidohydrolase YtcJ
MFTFASFPRFAYLVTLVCACALQSACAAPATARPQDLPGYADLIVRNAQVTTLDPAQPQAQALAVLGGKIVSVGSDADVMRLRGDATQVIDAGQRRLIPGLNDSHAHYLRGGLSFTTELRWDGVPTLAEALRRVAAQARVTPKGQWVRVVGGFTPWQFAEHRMPTPEELSLAAPETPVYIQYFYSVVVLNRAGIAAMKLADMKALPGTEIERDANGAPTGVVRATPNPALFYAMLAALPTPDAATASNSTRQLFHELSRFGLTSVIDAGGGGFDFPQDYAAPIAAAKDGQLPLRVSFYLFTQHPGKELDDYQKWIASNQIGQNLEEVREHGFELGGAGEWVLWKAGDYENFRSERPTQDADIEAQLEPVLRLFVQHRWPFRIHATYDESIGRILNVIERVNRTTPLAGLRWSFEHGETLQPPNMDRIKALGGGVAIQDRMFFLGDDFVSRYGSAAAGNAPPVRQLLERNIPVGMGTDATRSSFNPWLGLYFLVSGKVASGRTVLNADNRLSREEALRLYTVGSAWFSQEEQVKGRLATGQLADMALLGDDYMVVPEAGITRIESLLTIVDGKVVYGAGPYQGLAPALPPVIPAWSPLPRFGSFYRADTAQ